MLYAVIMAGGAGTRFWPASRTTSPKQLLHLVGERTMIQSTLDRLGDLVPPDQVLVVTNKRLVEPIMRQLPELTHDSVIGEPCKRDTAPCIGLAACMLVHKDPEAVMLVMPADHVIQPEHAFQGAISQALALVRDDPETIVTFGIPPTYPAEVFGYVERGEPLQSEGASQAYRVRRFREKPDARTARQYLDSGDFYWNSGIFVWKAKTIFAALQQYEPAMCDHLERIAAALGGPRFDAVLEDEFRAIEGKSIDYAVMEHYGNVTLLEAPFQWDDLGSWQALGRLRGVDRDGNTLVGHHLALRTTNTIVRSDDEHLIVTVGLDNLIVVRTPDATLVANRDDEESIREVVELIEQHGWSQHL